MAELGKFAYRSRMRSPGLWKGVAFVLMLMAPAARAGETRCWFENGVVVVPAAFDEIAGDFILDLSAPHSLLHVTAANAAGIDARGARGTLLLAGKTVSNLQVTVIGLDARTAPFVTPIAGVIGIDALAPYVVDLQTSPCRLTLYRQSPGRLAKAVRIPVRRIGGVPAVQAAISDGASSRTGWFALDTASLGVSAMQATYTRPPPALTDAALRADPPARLRALSLADTIFEQAPAAAGAHLSDGLSGAIGMAVWSRYHLRFDFQDGWLDLAPTAPIR